MATKMEIRRIIVVVGVLVGWRERKKKGTLVSLTHSSLLGWLRSPSRARAAAATPILFGQVARGMSPSLSWQRLARAVQQTVVCDVCFHRKPRLSYPPLWQDDDGGAYTPHLGCAGWLCADCAVAMQWRGIEYALDDGAGPPGWFRIECPFCRHPTSIGVTPRLGVRGLMRMIREQSIELRKLDLIQRVLHNEPVFDLVLEEEEEGDGLAHLEEGLENLEELMEGLEEGV